MSQPAKWTTNSSSGVEIHECDLWLLQEWRTVAITTPGRLGSGLGAREDVMWDRFEGSGSHHYAKLVHAMPSMLADLTVIIASTFNDSAFICVVVS